MVDENEGSLEKRRVQIIAPGYYSKKEVQEAIYNFCKNRETVPRYLEGFGKRPDVLDYPSDIMAFVKNGATSFHCSEEIWSDVLKINTDMTPEKYDEIRSGWDFLIDIDSKYIDYSKIAAKLIIKFLEQHGVNNVGIKFSGSKGFHLVIPWKAFPEEFFGEKTKNKFPEWPRAIANYISEEVHDFLVEEIARISNHKLEYDVIYKPTGENALTRKVSKYKCKNCKSVVDYMNSKKDIQKCGLCGYKVDKIGETELFYAESNKDNSQKNPSLFVKRPSVAGVIDTVDIVLVAPRHLFRAPYSLHEKTALVSAVLTKEELYNFEVSMADPLKLKIRNFTPDCASEEAKNLLLQALDWAKKKNKIEKKFDGRELNLKGLVITEDMYPEVIVKLLAGMKQDGRKRALSVLLSFFSSLELPKDYIETRIDEWNKKNFKPLKEGYIKSQIEWSLRNKRLPPNYDKSTYKELGVQSETYGLKNPINYTITQALRAGSSQNNSNSQNRAKQSSTKKVKNSPAKQE